MRQFLKTILVALVLLGASGTAMAQGTAPGPPGPPPGGGSPSPSTTPDPPPRVDPGEVTAGELAGGAAVGAALCMGFTGVADYLGGYEYSLEEFIADNALPCVAASGAAVATSAFFGPVAGVLAGAAAFLAVRYVEWIVEKLGDFFDWLFGIPGEPVKNEADAAIVEDDANGASPPANDYNCDPTPGAIGNSYCGF